MNVDKLARLFAAQDTSARPQAFAKVKAEKQELEQKSSEAVTLAKNFGGSAINEASEEERRKKVEQLKQEVASGRYVRDSKEIAKAVARELFG